MITKGVRGVHRGGSHIRGGSNVWSLSSPLYWKGEERGGREGGKGERRRGRERRGRREEERREGRGGGREERGKEERQGN